MWVALKPDNPNLHVLPLRLGCQGPTEGQRCTQCFSGTSVIAWVSVEVLSSRGGFRFLEQTTQSLYVRRVASEVTVASGWDCRVLSTMKRRGRAHGIP